MGDSEVSWRVKEDFLEERDLTGALKYTGRIKRCWESVPDRDHSTDIGWDGGMFGKHLSTDSD